METTLKELFNQFQSSESVDNRIVKSPEYLKAIASLSQTSEEIINLLSQTVSKTEAVEIMEKYDNLYRNYYDALRYNEFKVAFTAGIKIGISTRNESDDMFISKIERILKD